MLKKTITYTNPFTDQEVSEEHYFHISKADLVEMEMEEHKDEYWKEGKKFTGMQAKIQRIVDSEDGKAILSEMKDMIRRAYGKKDGDRFRKSSEIWEEFSSSEAFSQLVFDLCTDASAAGEFINGIIPGNLEQIKAEVQAIAEREDAENGATAIAAEAPIGLEEPTASSTMDALSKASNALGEGDPTVRTLTREEALAMDHKELQAGLVDGHYKLS